MSKGKNPPPTQPPVNPRDPGNPPPGDPPSRCWTFQLVDVTSAAKTVRNGASASGTLSDNRVLVLSGGVAIGYAPVAYSAEMIAAVEDTGGRLLGRVVSGEEAAEVIVELCVR